jgi:hypothetical protein
LAVFAGLPIVFDAAMREGLVRVVNCADPQPRAIYLHPDAGSYDLRRNSADGFDNGMSR